MFLKNLAAIVLGVGVGGGITTGVTPVARSASESYRAFGKAVAIAGDFAFVGEPNVCGFGRGGGRGGAPPAAGVVHVYRGGAATARHGGRNCADLQARR